MKERPIPFNDEMVRAILDGRKTQTRRVMKTQPPEHFSPLQLPADEVLGQVRHAVLGLETSWVARCPYGAPGDRLWVREAWQCVGWDEDGNVGIAYRAGGESKWGRFGGDDFDLFVEAEAERLVRHGAKEDERGWLELPEGTASPWRPSIHMPRWAARIALEITDVRVQRLQDISEEDARAEGVIPAPFCRAGRAAGLEHVESFAELWERNNGAGSWDAEPWVWVLSFRVVQAPAEVKK